MTRPRRWGKGRSADCIGEGTFPFVFLLQRAYAGAVQQAIDPIASLYVSARMALARKKSGALVARRIVRPAFTSKLVDLARGRCLAENTVTPAVAGPKVWNSGIGGVSGESIIPPA